MWCMSQAQAEVTRAQYSQQASVAAAEKQVADLQEALKAAKASPPAVFSLAAGLPPISVPVSAPSSVHSQAVYQPISTRFESASLSLAQGEPGSRPASAPAFQRLVSTLSNSSFRKPASAASLTRPPSVHSRGRPTSQGDDAELDSVPAFDWGAAPAASPGSSDSSAGSAGEEDSSPLRVAAEPDATGGVARAGPSSPKPGAKRVETQRASSGRRLLSASRGSLAGSSRRLVAASSGKALVSGPPSPGAASPHKSGNPAKPGAKPRKVLSGTRAGPGARPAAAGPVAAGGAAAATGRSSVRRAAPASAEPARTSPGRSSEGPREASGGSSEESSDGEAPFVAVSPPTASAGPGPEGSAPVVGGGRKGAALDRRRREPHVAAVVAAARPPMPPLDIRPRSIDECAVLFCLRSRGRAGLQVSSHTFL